MLAHLLLGAAAMAPAASQQPRPHPVAIVSQVLVEQRTTGPDGAVKIALVPAAHVAPGDRVTVVVTCRNGGAVPLADLAVANPVPRGMRFRTAQDFALELSVDGVRFGPLASLTVPLPGGGTRPARPDDVSAVRWRPAAPLAPQASGRFSFAATIQ